ncbi:hypothetical protein LBW59_13595 [Ralstonia solanacearum]|uniref:NusG domain-containing protein n=1 Tax=Ralstonia solanacearum TaxID=305 RepID=A0AAW5ZQT3_RALSL|nr:hypothetical protein [Ralstonia solanacearum]MDB0571798.1 hypothetical protein [Ralstonia solanacearum]
MQKHLKTGLIALGLAAAWLSILFFIDAIFFPETIETSVYYQKVLPGTKAGEVYYIVPCTGADVGHCKVADVSGHPYDQPILVTKTRILNRCTITARLTETPTKCH